ncbi:hypothetical protein NE236_43005 [Actinoallomurus purpureus]|uniref:hypothetical protein n=1 Tax=Actinoallomurus purpureus TaxID=478114 RepID=UPI00209347B6|nr:hypothetical protein [Actinoallomurus purpureus]MCO6011737.1 hypothetical protein [Actinoallomurus purpureus]
MSDQSTSALALLDLEDSAITETIQQLAGESFTVADLMSALWVFTAAAVPDRLEDLPAETIEIRRSHLAVLVALVDAVRACLATMFRAIDLEGRIPDADMLDPVHDGLAAAGEGLAEIVSVLHNPRD